MDDIDRSNGAEYDEDPVLDDHLLDLLVILVVLRAVAAIDVVHVDSSLTVGSLQWAVGRSTVDPLPTAYCQLPTAPCTTRPYPLATRKSGGLCSPACSNRCAAGCCWRSAPPRCWP